MALNAGEKMIEEIVEEVYEYGNLIVLCRNSTMEGEIAGRTMQGRIVTGELGMHCKW